MNRVFPSIPQKQNWHRLHLGQQVGRRWRERQQDVKTSFSFSPSSLSGSLPLMEMPAWFESQRSCPLTFQPHSKQPPPHLLSQNATQAEGLQPLVLNTSRAHPTAELRLYYSEGCLHALQAALMWGLSTYTSLGYDHLAVTISAKFQWGAKTVIPLWQHWWGHVHARLYFLKQDERFSCQPVLPEVWVVMRTYSGELFQGMNSLGWTDCWCRVWPEANIHTYQNRKRSGRSSKKPKTHQTTF